MCRSEVERTAVVRQRRRGATGASLDRMMDCMFYCFNLSAVTMSMAGKRSAWVSGVAVETPPGSGYDNGPRGLQDGHIEILRAIVVQKSVGTESIEL